MKFPHARILAWLLPSLASSIALCLPQDWYVDLASPFCPVGNGSSTQPFCEIQAAIDAASNGDTIHVAPGTYVENLLVNKELTILGTGGREVTIVDGNYSGTAIVVGSPAHISGFTITRGKPQYAWAGGVGVYSHLTLTNSTITENVVEYTYSYGAGIGIYFGGELVLRDSLVTNNVLDGARNYGSAIYGGNAEIVNCRIEGNRTTGIFGAAAVSLHGDVTITNSTIIGNETLADYSNGIEDLTVGYADLELTNCTIGEMVFSGTYSPNPPSTAVIKNCVFGTGAGFFHGSGFEIDVTVHSTISPWQFDFPGTNNILGVPQFTNPATGDYRLLPTSLGVDAGNNAFVPAGITLDVTGKPRFRDVLAAPDRGQGAAPIVDMGAFESTNVWSGTPLPPARGISR